MMGQEEIDETNVDLIYQHISARASQILQSKNKKHAPLKQAMTMMDGVPMMNFDEDDDADAAFDIQESEFALGPRNKGQKGQKKKRSNSFKLGSRPREMKDQVRKTYRRNSFHAKAIILGEVDIMTKVAVAKIAIQ